MKQLKIYYVKHRQYVAETRTQVCRTIGNGQRIFGPHPLDKTPCIIQERSCLFFTQLIDYYGEYLVEKYKLVSLQKRGIKLNFV